MGEMKPTPGVWKWDSDPMKGDPLGRVRYRVVTTGKTITQCYYSSSDEHSESDARLISEAGTVFHETGLSPRQLVDLLQAIVRAADSEIAQGGEMWFAETVAPPIDDARAALTKASASSISKGVE